jgi:FtsP/CotA-like multicopper oxidase with cupredoxin domain
LTQPGPKADIEPRLYRLRVLNGSNARTYRLVLLDDLGNILNNFTYQGNKVIYQIGCDQGLMNNKEPVLDTGLILSPGERVDLLVNFSGFENRQLYFWNIAEAPFSDTVNAEPNPAQIQTGLKNLRADLFAFAESITADEMSSAVNRRYYPQIMRFDVINSLSGSSHMMPDDPLVPSARPDVSFASDDMPPIRLMALVEKPAETTKRDGTPILDGTAKLVFWEYVEIPENTDPPKSRRL